MFFTFPEDARWDAERQGVEIGEHRGMVRVPRRVFPAAPARAARPSAVRRSVLPPTDAVREHRRTKASTGPVDRGWECLDQRAGLALSRRWETVPPARGASQIDPQRSFGAGL
jgi:hypothetical protein